MKIPQYFFMTILNPIYKLTEKINIKTRQYICGLAWFFMLAFFYLGYTSKTGFNMEQRQIVGAVLLIVIIIMSVDRKLKPVEWNPVFCAIWFLFSVTFFIVNIIYDLGTGYLPFSFSLLFLFPCLYFVWNNRRDYDVLFTQVSKALVTVFVLFFIISICVAPLEGDFLMNGRYKGLVTHPNTIGVMSLSVITVCLYLISNEERLSWVYIVICGLAMSMEIFCMSRTSFLAIVLTLIAFVILFFKYTFKKSPDKLKCMIKFILIFVLMIGIVPFVRSMFMSDTSGSSLRPGTVISYAEQENVEPNEKIDEEDQFVERWNVEGRDLNQISSGRIGIWKVYLKYMGLTGHTVDNSPAPEETREISGGWSHNVFIEIGYRAGIILGILYFCLMILVIVRLFDNIFLHKIYYDDYMMFTTLSTVAFVVVSMLEMLMFPLAYETFLLYFIGIAPIFERKKKVLASARDSLQKASCRFVKHMLHHRVKN